MNQEQSDFYVLALPFIFREFVNWNQNYSVEWGAISLKVYQDVFASDEFCREEQCHVPWWR